MKKIRLKHAYLIKQTCYFLVGLFFLWGCSDTSEIEPEDRGKNYFPVDTGIFNIYTVKKIVYGVGFEPDTTFYQLKEVIADTFMDLENDLAYKIERFKRYKRKTFSDTQNLNPDWQIDSVWHLKINHQRLIKNKNNLPFIMLSFPLYGGKTWDANHFNAKSTNKYRVEDYDNPMSINGQKFQKTLKLIQKVDTLSIIDRNFSYEVYARNYGLVKKVIENVEFCQPTEPDCQGEIQSGIYYRQVLIDHGNE